MAVPRPTEGGPYDRPAQRAGDDHSPDHCGGDAETAHTDLPGRVCGRGAIVSSPFCGTAPSANLVPMTDRADEPEPDDDVDVAAEAAAVRAPGRVARTRAEISTRFARLRGRSAIVDSLAQTWEHDAEVGGGVFSGALAFRLFLFLVPYVLFVFTALGTTSEALQKSPESLASAAGISGLLAKGVLNTTTLSTGQKWTVLFVSGYATFTASRSLVKTLSASVSLAWKIPRVRLGSTKPALVFIVFFTVATYLTAGLGRLRAAAPTPGIALTIGWLAVPFVSIWWLMARLPRRATPTWALIPGAVVAAIGFQIMHLATVVFIAPSAVSKTEIYGVIGIALTTLLWCYIAGRLVIGSTVLNAALWRRYEEHHPEEAKQQLDPNLTLVQRTTGALKASISLFR